MDLLEKITNDKLRAAVLGAFAGEQTVEGQQKVIPGEAAV